MECGGATSPPGAMDATATSGANCGVCLECLGPNGHRLECGHEFHANCIVQWFRRPGVSSCPICRDDPQVSRDSTSDDDSESEYDFLDALSPSALHRFVVPLLRACGRAEAPRRLRLLAERYRRSRARMTEARSSLWRHERTSVGRFSDLRKTSRRLGRALERETLKYYDSARDIVFAVGIP